MIKLKMVECHECQGTGAEPDESAGPALRAERLKLGIGLRQLSRALDVSATYIMDIESASRRLNNRIAAQYLAKLKELTNGTGAK